MHECCRADYGQACAYRYIIPYAVIRHFMEEFEMHGSFRGCCALGFRYQDMENKHLRESLKVTGMALNPTASYPFVQFHLEVMVMPTVLHRSTDATINLLVIFKHYIMATLQCNQHVYRGPATHLAHAACRDSPLSTCCTAVRVSFADARTAALQMSDSMSGSLVFKLEPLAPAAQVLRINDVVLAIEGVAVADDGTIEFRDEERVDFAFQVRGKHIGARGPSQAGDLWCVSCLSSLGMVPEAEKS